MDELEGKITKVLEDEGYRETVELGALELAKKHTYEERVKTLLGLYEDLREN